MCPACSPTIDHALPSHTLNRNVRDPAWAAVVNGDPELLQYVRNIKLSAEDQKAKMRNLAAPVFAAQVGRPWLLLCARGAAFRLTCDALPMQHAAVNRYKCQVVLTLSPGLRAFSRNVALQIH